MDKQEIVTCSTLSKLHNDFQSYLYEVPVMVRLNSGCRGSGRRREELMFSGCIVSIWGDGKSMVIDGGGCGTVMCNEYI